MLTPERFAAARRTALDSLLAERNAAGHWEGELSTSALSTATAVMALHAAGRPRAFVDAGLQWLANHHNADGAWGDTTRSLSNISTTLLCRAAFHFTGRAGDFTDAVAGCERWLASRYGSTPAEQAEAVRRRYGKDRTFSVPILMTCALAGLVPWREVPSLPFELACLPQEWYRYARLPVVSYALPALIAIGQCVYRHRPPWNPATRLARSAAIAPSLRVLDAIQPPNGGFLEAAPLTSFVTLGLATTGRSHHPVVERAVGFLERSVRADGSWPIDTNLATWVTTLAINALATDGDLSEVDRHNELRTWLSGQQYRERHPYTGADPGGWAWTDLPGGVPDCDDTPGALLALRHLGGADSSAVQAGLGWVRSLQNADGGWPTFCRGWTEMPFDRSGADLTAHALRALHAWRAGHGRSIPRGLAYLARTQRPDGSWLPLWFGNQHAPDDENPVYGTARVLMAYRDLRLTEAGPCRRGVAYLLRAQNADGGWGGTTGVASSVEETALAVEALAGTARPRRRLAVRRGVEWLVHAVESGAYREASPIGFYFAKLWYFERMYPLAFTVAALGAAAKVPGCGG